MRTLLALTIMTFSVAAIANCKTEARNIAEDAVRIFNVNDQDIHCMAVGSLESIKSLPVIMVMPQPVVNMLLNQECKIVDLQVSGFNL